MDGRLTRARRAPVTLTIMREGALAWQEGALLSMLMMMPEALDSATELTILHETMILIDAALSACQRRNDVVPVVLETPGSEEVRRLCVRTRASRPSIPIPPFPYHHGGSEEADRAYITRTLPPEGARVSGRVSAP